MSHKKRQGRKTRNYARRTPLWLSVLLAAGLTLFSIFSVWYVHHPRRWLIAYEDILPSYITAAIYSFGNPIGDITDSLGLTGHDTIYEYDELAPENSVHFAGLPVRIGSPAPADIRVLKRGDFIIGWSDSLRHPVWVAYHVPAEARFPSLSRPAFTKDKELELSPAPQAYTNSGMDRGHMAPNYAIATRFGEGAQKLTFQMSNIAPQTPQLNRGVWRDVEHRIADLWTAKYGEIWVIVGCFGSVNGSQFIISDHIEIPEYFYQIIVAQEGYNVRALAVLFDQDVGWNDWAARHLISIDELEDLTGLDFLSELPSFIQNPLEAELPSRLWPVKPTDALKSLLNHFGGNR